MHDGVVDFCFTARGFTAGLEKRVVYHDELVALLPAAHPLTAKEKVTLADLASEPFVLLDEGEQSLVLDAFAAYGLSPHVTSEVTDDYTIMAMVEEGLGVSMLYRRTVEHASRYSCAAHRACSLTRCGGCLAQLGHHAHRHEALYRLYELAYCQLMTGVALSAVFSGLSLWLG